MMTSNIFLRSRCLKPQWTDDYDCTLCLKLLYEPITTSCRHSFCYSCLFQSMNRVLLITPQTVSISSKGRSICKSISMKFVWSGWIACLSIYKIVQVMCSLQCWSLLMSNQKNLGFPLKPIMLLKRLKRMPLRKAIRYLCMFILKLLHMKLKKLVIVS